MSKTWKRSVTFESMGVDFVGVVELDGVELAMMKLERMYDIFISLPTKIIRSEFPFIVSVLGLHVWFDFLFLSFCLGFFRQFPVTHCSLNPSRLSSHRDRFPAGSNHVVNDYIEHSESNHYLNFQISEL